MTASRQLISMRGSSAIFRAASARSARPCRAPVSFSGLPGVSSHQTRSSLSRLIANRLMARCAACGGLNEPPSRPMRMPLVWNGIARASDCWAINDATAGAALVAKTPIRSRPRLPGAADAIFEARQLLGADRPAGVEFAGGDADFGAEAEFAAIGELRRCVVQHD